MNDGIGASLADAEHGWGLGVELRRVQSRLCESWAGTGRQCQACTSWWYGWCPSQGGEGGMSTVVFGQELSVSEVSCAREPPACKLFCESGPTGVNITLCSGRVLSREVGLTHSIKSALLQCFCIRAGDLNGTSVFLINVSDCACSLIIYRTLISL